jgi:hypothetical protein
MAARQWTAEQRARQATLIRGWQPWLASTGPSTEKGKRRVAKNAYQGAKRTELRQFSLSLNNLLNEAQEKLASIEKNLNNSAHDTDSA